MAIIVSKFLNTAQHFSNDSIHLFGRIDITDGSSIIFMPFATSDMFNFRSSILADMQGTISATKIRRIKANVLTNSLQGVASVKIYDDGVAVTQLNIPAAGIGIRDSGDLNVDIAGGSLAAVELLMPNISGLNNIVIADIEIQVQRAIS